MPQRSTTSYSLSVLLCTVGILASPVPGARADAAPLIEVVEAVENLGEGLNLLGAEMVGALGETLSIVLAQNTDRSPGPGTPTLIEPLPQMVRWNLRTWDEGMHAVSLAAGYSEVLRYRGRSSFFSELEGEAGIEYRFTLQNQDPPNRGKTENPPQSQTLILLRLSPLHASLTAVQLRPLIPGTQTQQADFDDPSLAVAPGDRSLPALFRLGSRITTAFEQRMGPVKIGMIVSVAAQATPKLSKKESSETILNDPGVPHTEAVYLRMPLTALTERLHGVVPDAQVDWLGKKQKLPPLHMTVRLMHRDRGEGLETVLQNARLQPFTLGSLRELWEFAVIFDTKF